MPKDVLYLWEDWDGVVHTVKMVIDECVKMFHEPGREYVSIKTTDENRYHTAITRFANLVPVRA